MSNEVKDDEVCNLKLDADVASVYTGPVNAEAFKFLNKTGRKKFYDQGYYGQGIVVAVIDSGVSNHNEFETGKIITGKNFCTSTCSPDHQDNLGHGTHVAGTIAGKLSGVAPKARILPVKVFNALGESSVNWIIQALQWTLAWRGPAGEKVDIVNMSLSSIASVLEQNPTLLNQYHVAIQNLVKAGIPVIVAAGNTGDTTKLYPAAFAEVITVGALDANMKSAFFSTRSTEVDVSQRGTDILSASFRSPSTYEIMSGTSMATPLVTGIAALILSKYKARFKKPMSEPAFYEMLKMSTVDVDALGIDSATGAGFCTLNPTRKMIMKVKKGDKNIVIDGVTVPSDVAPTIVEERLMLPLRYTTEKILDATVSWDQPTETSTIEIDV